MPSLNAPLDVILWIVEDNQEFSENISELINRTQGLRCERSFPMCEDAMTSLMNDAAPDALLMDIGLPGINGIDGIKKIKAIAPTIQVIMLTVFDDHEKIFQAICAGASGYLLKSVSNEKIIESLKEILVGGAPINAQIARKILEMFSRLAAPKEEYGLTPRENEILRLIVDGKTKKQIADQIFLSFHTIDTHLRSIYAKLQVHSRSGAIAKALKEHLL